MELEAARRRHRYSSAHAYPWYEMGVGGRHHATADLPREGDPVPKVHKGGWALELVWIGVEKSRPHQVSHPKPSSP